MRTLAVCSYIAAQRGRLPRVALLCAMGGANAAATLADLEQACGKPPLATLALRQADIKSGRATPALDEFVQRLACPCGCRHALPGAQRSSNLIQPLSGSLPVIASPPFTAHSWWA